MFKFGSTGWYAYVCLGFTINLFLTDAQPAGAVRLSIGTGKFGSTFRQRLSHKLDFSRIIYP